MLRIVAWLCAVITTFTALTTLNVFNVDQAQPAEARPMLQIPTETLVPPVETPTSVLPPPVATPTSVLLPAPGAEVCPHLRGLVPDAVLNAALANPRRIGGFETARNPNKPPSPMNPLRRYLSLSNPNVPFHPIFNRPVWVAGCPWSHAAGQR